MDKEIKTWLFDILQSIHEIECFLEGQPKVFHVFANDLKTKRAIERELEIIGEAVNRILKKDSTIQISNARKIVDARNKIIHGYDSLTDDLIWSIVINHIPLLKTEVELLIKL